MARCFICGKYVEDNGNQIQFCEGSNCIFQWWAEFHKKYATGRVKTPEKPLYHKEEKTVISGKELRALRGDRSTMEFARIIHSKSSTVERQEAQEVVSKYMVDKIETYLTDTELDRVLKGRKAGRK